MRKTLWDAQTRQELVGRVELLKPDMPARWGRMNAPQMLAHLVDWMRMARGDLPTAFRDLPLQYPGIKQLAIYMLPFPKGLPTAAELSAREPSDWETEHASLCRHIQSFEKLRAKAKWPVHPAFGVLTSKAWGVLGYRHTDHHLRQFGV